MSAFILISHFFVVRGCGLSNLNSLENLNYTFQRFHPSLWIRPPNSTTFASINKHANEIDSHLVPSKDTKQMVLHFLQIPTSWPGEENIEHLSVWSPPPKLESKNYCSAPPMKMKADILGYNQVWRRKQAWPTAHLGTSLLMIAEGVGT